MKLLRYGPPGEEKPGLLDSTGAIRDLSGVVPDIARDTLLPDSLDRLAQDRSGDAAARRGHAAHRPVRRAGRQVHLRRAELLRSRRGIRHGGAGRADRLHEGDLLHRRPERRHRAAARVAEDRLGSGARRRDRQARRSTSRKQDALSHVAGYCVVNDLSERAYQLEGTGQWVKGKSADTFGPIGPWLVTTDEVPDLGQPRHCGSTWTAHRHQDGSTKTMIFGVPYLVSYLSRFMSLQSGRRDHDRHAAGRRPRARNRRCICAPATKCGSEWKGWASSARGLLQIGS